MGSVMPDIEIAECLMKLKNYNLTDDLAEEDKLKILSQLEDLFKLDNEDGRFDLSDDIQLNEIQTRAKKAFKVVMQMQPDDGRDQRMPHRSQVDLLHDIDPVLCQILRNGSVKDFYTILYPTGRCPEKNLKDTMFSLEGTAADVEIFKDLKRRAELLADEIKKKVDGLDGPNTKVKCYLLDGYGRMLLSLVKALIDKGIDPDSNVEFIIVEMDEQVHEYHRYVFPRVVQKLNQNVIQGYGDYIANNSVVYLNFCSVPSSPKQSSPSPPRFVKENVLRFIDRVTRRDCPVMVSLVIKDIKGEPFPEDVHGDRYVTGLGFIEVLRDEQLFNSGDSDIFIRPDDGIKWEDDSKRKPEPFDNKRFHPFVSILIHPPSVTDQTQNLEAWFKEKRIVYDFIPNEKVKVTTGGNSVQGEVMYQVTPRMVYVKTSSGKKHVCTSSVQRVEQPGGNGDNSPRTLRSGTCLPSSSGSET